MATLSLCQRCRMRNVFFKREIYCEVCLNQRPWTIPEEQS